MGIQAEVGLRERFSTADAVKIYHASERLKSANLSTISSIDTAVTNLTEGIEAITYHTDFNQPLFQARSILALADEDCLLEQVENVNLENPHLEVRVAARIPFMRGSSAVAEYYLQAENPFRYGETSESIAQQQREAFDYVEQRRRRPEKPLGENYEIAYLMFEGETGYNVATGEKFHLSREQLAHEMAETYGEDFGILHDRNLISAEYIYPDLNELVVAVANGNDIAAFCQLDADPSFNILPHALRLEGTWATKIPHRGHGLSHHIRREIGTLADAGVIKNRVYVTESRLTDSARYSLVAGWHAAANQSGRINAGLGAYVPVADENTVMLVTYKVTSDLRVK